MNIYEKIQTIRVEFKKQNIRMSGHNEFAKYDYFELDDFLTPLNELMLQHKMTAIPSFTAELASLIAINLEKPDETITVTSPFGGAQLKGCHEVQNIGAVETYQRRYLYQAMFDISESDALNGTQGKPEKESGKKSEPRSRYQCHVCGKEISEKLYTQSSDKYNVGLCSAECRDKYLKAQKQLSEAEGEIPF